MINAQELRIGNLVTDEFYESFKTIIKVDSINDKGINLAIEDDGNFPECANRWIEPYYKFDTLCGIPLTEEILLKCGFKYREAMAGGQDEWAGYGFWSLNDIHLLGHKNGKILYYDRRNKVEYKYLHQLQNLIYSLTNKELEINL